MRRWLAMFAVLLAAGALCADAEKAEPKVEVAGLRIVAPAPQPSMLAFDVPVAGTTVSLLISSPKGGFVQFDHGNSTISKFVDEKGNDLLAKIEGEAVVTNIGFSLFPKILDGGKACGVEIFAPRVPVKGSASLQLSGVITMLCATEKKEHSVGTVALKDGTKFKLDALEFSVENVGKPYLGDEPLSLVLRTRQDLSEVAAVKFFGADGHEIPSRRTSTSKMGLFGAWTIEWSYNLAEKADNATVKIYTWVDMQKQRVNFDLRF